MHVYWIRHPDHTDIFRQGYIGVSDKPEERWAYHKKRQENNHLRNAINMYGWDVLLKETVLIGDKDYCLYIESKLRPEDKTGWNIVKGGGLPPSVPWNKGKSVSAKQAERLRQLRIGKPSPRKGKTHTPEAIEKMRLAKLGKRQTPESIEKARQKKLGKKQPLVSCPHCNKIGGSQTMPRWHFDNCRDKGVEQCPQS